MYLYVYIYIVPRASMLKLTGTSYADNVDVWVG